ncbi:hypothetical protein HQ38_05220 [Porphyromonas crevioricanis]|uniref:Uncharacterized protein n=1 Tax=Porphyromonas crevioricanis TaxID=393921 RepID=A0AB34PK23_9PORP|nr:hypothetical protein HQ38_05220 [Porphyromonas crevioricanis]
MTQEEVYHAIAYQGQFFPRIFRTTPRLERCIYVYLCVFARAFFRSKMRLMHLKFLPLFDSYGVCFSVTPEKAKILS